MTETPGRYNAEPDPTLATVNSKLDILIEQIGKLTEGLTEIRLTAQAQSDAITRQSATVDRLVGIIERLIERQA